jgi:hypothetical protein
MFKPLLFNLASFSAALLALAQSAGDLAAGNVSLLPHDLLTLRVEFN